MDSLSHNMEEVLNSQGVLVSTTSGVSMLPMLRDRKDTIIIKKPEGRLKKYDVALYRRGEQYVLHRVVKVLPDSYIICGDNCESLEYGITDRQIIGVLDAFYRGEKYIPVTDHTYRIYARVRCALFPFRRFTRITRRRIRKLLR